MSHPKDHAVVRYNPKGMNTMVFFPFMTTDPNWCPTVTITGGRAVPGHHGMLKFDLTYPANANPESTAVLQELVGSKSMRINGEMHQAILKGTGETAEITAP